MINANEVRIGNKVGFYKSGIQDVQIGTISEIELPEDNCEYHFTIPEFSKTIPLTGAALKPISLTPEILEKCGFTDRSADKNGIAVRIDINSMDQFAIWFDEGYIRYQTIGSGFVRRLEHIRYLHQLQNLYFDLTGKNSL